MKIATIDNGTEDGALVAVSRDGTRIIRANAICSTMQQAIENWDSYETRLSQLAEDLESGAGEQADGVTFRAPLPRSWQWLDGSAFESHGKLMEIAFDIDPVESDKPLMYQGVSNQFYGPKDDIVFPDESDGIDFEGEFAVIVDAVPMGVSASEAMKHIKLIVQLNDWSLRAIAPVEMKTGFGWVQAKPPCSVAPLAVTPDELGEHWRDGRVCLDLNVDWNGKQFGHANGEPMGFGFHELVAHAAKTRKLCAGTIIGSGTVSNENYREVGSSCIAERRAIELVDEGAPKTAFMKFGDTVRMEAFLPDGMSLFGAIQQKVVSL